MTPAEPTVSVTEWADGGLQVAGAHRSTVLLWGLVTLRSKLPFTTQLSVSMAERLAFQVSSHLWSGLQGRCNRCGAASRNTQDLDLVRVFCTEASPRCPAGVYSGKCSKSKENPKPETEIEEGHSDPRRGQKWQELQGIFLCVYIA